MLCNGVNEQLNGKSVCRFTVVQEGLFDIIRIPLLQLDWDRVKVRIWRTFVAHGADTFGATHWGTGWCPLVRLCRRQVDGEELLKCVDLDVECALDLKNRMLEEAVKRGSVGTVKVGLVQ